MTAQELEESAPQLTIITVHGNGGGGFRFERMHSYMPPHVALVCPTLPGFANEPKDPSLTTLSDFADRLHPVVQQAQQMKGKIVLLGHGIGGSIALDYLQRHAKAIDGLILHAPVGAMLDKRAFPMFIRIPGVAMLGQHMFASALLRPYFARRLFKHPVPAEFQARFFGEYANCRVFADMFFMINHQWFSSLHPIETPTIILWGEDDNVLTPDQIDAFRPLLHAHKIVRPANWAHFPMCDMPKEYCNQIVSLATDLVNQK